MVEIAEWRSSAKASVTFDPAALIPLETVRPVDGPVQTLGVSVMSLAGSHSSALANPDFPQLFGEILTHLFSVRPHLNVRVVVVRGGAREDDNSVSEDLVASLARVDSSRVSLVPYQEDVHSLVRELGQCDAVAGMRFHSVLLGYLCRRPIVALAYHRKVRDLADEVGLPDEGLIDLTRPVDSRELQSALEGLLDRPQDFVAALPVDVAVDRARTGLDLELIRSNPC
jgi:polysaccharide pyruvyl transferase WcaK-like protein